MRWGCRWVVISGRMTGQWLIPPLQGDGEERESEEPLQRTVHTSTARLAPIDTFKMEGKSSEKVVFHSCICSTHRNGMWISTETLERRMQLLLENWVPDKGKDHSIVTFHLLDFLSPHAEWDMFHLQLGNRTSTSEKVGIRRVKRSRKKGGLRQSE